MSSNSKLTSQSYYVLLRKTFPLIFEEPDGILSTSKLIYFIIKPGKVFISQDDWKIKVEKCPPRSFFAAESDFKWIATKMALTSYLHVGAFFRLRFGIA